MSVRKTLHKKAPSVCGGLEKLSGEVVNRRVFVCLRGIACVSCGIGMMARASLRAANTDVRSVDNIILVHLDPLVVQTVADVF